MAQTPQRRSAAAPPDPSLPPQPQQTPHGHLDQARMVVSYAMGQAESNKSMQVRGRTKGFLDLDGMYEALAPLLSESSLALSSALAFAEGANMFVIRTKVTSLLTGESDHSDIPLASIQDKNDIGGMMTYGTRYNIMALFSFYPSPDEVPSVTGGSFAVVYGSNAAPARTGYGRPAQSDVAPAQAPWPGPAPVLDPATGQWVGPGQQQPVMAAPDLGPPPLPQFQAPAQTGVQRTDPIAYPVYDPSVAPQVLS